MKKSAHNFRRLAAKARILADQSTDPCAAKDLVEFAAADRDDCAARLEALTCAMPVVREI